MIKKYWYYIPIVLLIFFLSKKIGKLFSAGGILSVGDNSEMQKKRIEDIAATKFDQSKMTKDMAAISNIANSLYQSMQDLGTNEERIFQSLQGLTAEDLKAVYKSFGIREDSLFGLGGILTVMKGDLFDWFRAEFNDSDYKKIETLFSKTGLI